MNTRDLRIGNWITLGNGGAYRVISIDINQVGIEDNPNKFHIDGASGLEISNEWLVNGGFIKEEQAEGFYHINIGRQGFYVSLEQGQDWYVTYRADIGLSYEKLGFVDYVHTLQNLIYSLTGQELIFDRE